ncbi:hypothetical protein FEF65_09480 [Mariprofundus erugo]|uniref:DegT/DnrJ/EryC1/StrS aminotransferase family protein n=1 Tax=Mariprofundus erugo TaxID=2528639 RepID=A0A5R9GJC8_9PROT|nr:DegT/DnrJ/EryC1/StrS family aminotransferase [Mariprofundus erugo]TLS66741.1 hypothetical protein FEF65_09480 [Mariprofundus erugo]
MLSIRRAFPKYLDENMLSSVDGRSSAVSGYYFNRGAAALKFLLKFLSRDKSRPTVCMQSFNCTSVMDAALQACCKVVLSDVKLTDFSISFEWIANNHESFDILLLTHYQGIVNVERSEIIEFCKCHGVLVIEDLAHCAKGIVDVQGDFGIYSYAFDKPYTCMDGGEVVIHSRHGNLIESFLDAYSNVPLEEMCDNNLDLRLLRFLFQFSDENNYLAYYNNFSMIRNCLSLHVPSLLLKSKFFLSMMSTFHGKFRKNVSSDISIRRIRENKITLIGLQEKNCVDNLSKNVANMDMVYAGLCKKFGVSLSFKGVLWNRYVMIDASGEIKDSLRLEGVEVGNYNWPIPLHRKFKINSVVSEGDYVNTDYLSSNIVNIPSWSEYLSVHIIDSKSS